jgi:hypothetical protein
MARSKRMIMPKLNNSVNKVWDWFIEMCPNFGGFKKGVR